MKSSRILLAVLGAALAPALADAQPLPFRPPAVPLVASDPYFSIWSDADRLTDDVTRHWTWHENSLVSLIRIDGQAYRLMGREPSDIPALPQTSVQVLPTRSIYKFENAAVHVTLTFMTPALPSDLDVYARPATYLTWQVRSADGAAHAVSLYDSASAQIAVDAPDQSVEWSRRTIGDLTALCAGAKDQTLFSPPGDDTRIHWGYAYLAASHTLASASIGAADVLERQFTDSGKLPASDDARSPRAANDQAPTLALAFDLGRVTAAPVTRHAILAYDQIYAIKFFGEKLRPYWRRNGATIDTLLPAAERDYSALVRRCAQFDDALMADMTRAGGVKYAQMGALAYRQCVAGCGLAADRSQKPLLFTKESSSDGDIATVDIIFPMAPQWLLLSPTLAKASLVPILEYAASSRWKFPNAPHDLGIYPVARGTDDGGEQMPVEESGNVLLLCDAIAHAEGNAAFATKWWPQLTQWTEYLAQYGLDPEDQLCTDDFMGHLAHNSNLAIKAILALAAYGDLCRMRGDTVNANKYLSLARADARHWVETNGTSDYSRLAYDKPGTWSQKYNLVWDQILRLNIFPASVAQREVAHYKTVLQPYGLPLDSRTKLTKTDWSYWSASLADNQTDFETLTAPMYHFFNATATRTQFADSYFTDDLKGACWFHARPVVGGVFVKMLTAPTLWKKWAATDKTGVSEWAPLPAPPRITEVMATSAAAPQVWRYTTVKPSDDWMKPGFDDSHWKSGPAPFGSTPASRTSWTDTPGDIWIRRQATLPDGDYHDLQFTVMHDEDVEIYANGVLAAKASGYNASYEPMDMLAPTSAFQPGAAVTIAAHCTQKTGGQVLDLGLIDLSPAPK